MNVLMASIFVTKLSYSSRNVRLSLSAALFVFLLPAQSGLAQIVPLQANIDASAQRRLQEQAELARRQRRIEDHLQRIIPALDPQNLSGPKANRITSAALAALFSLQTEGVSPREALRRALDCANLPSRTTRASSNYLLQCWESVAPKMNSTLAQSMRTGSPAPPPLTPFSP